MKVCFDYEIFWKQSFSGVASRYYYNLINCLLETNKLDLKVFAGFYINEKLSLLSKDTISGIKIKRKIPLTGKIFEKINLAFCNYKISKYNPNIIHKTYYNSDIKKKKSKIVLTVFDLWHEKNSNFKILPKKKSLVIADHILCPSNKTKKDLIDIYKINEKKITVTYFGIENFKDIPENNLDIKYEKPYILYVGTRGRYKNFENLAKAFSLSDKLKNDFILLCFGGGTFSKEENDLFKRYNILKSVVKHNENNDQSLLNLYKNARCLVYPSSHEGLGLPPLEAMSLGCPVITSNHEAIIEGVGSAASIFDPHNIDDISDQIENTVYSDEIIKKLILKGKAQAKNFSWHKCASETYDVYLKV
jgi:glycosyltransferase involved in cell wall biosynthesis